MADPSTVPAGARHIPGARRGLSVPRRPVAGSSTWARREPPPAAQLLLRRLVGAAFRAPSRWSPPRPASTGSPSDRGRGAPARVLLDQGVRPAFNVRYRDDKSYPYLAVTLDEEYPRLQVMRGAKRKGVRYFGPSRTPGPSARRSTCCCGSSRRAPAERCVQAGRPDRPAVPARRHRQVLRPCVGRVNAAEHRRSSRTSATSWPARPTPWSAGWSGR